MKMKLKRIRKSLYFYKEEIDSDIKNSYINEVRKSNALSKTI